MEFDSATPVAAVTCAACKRPVGAEYYSVGKSVVCGACKAATEQSAPAKASPAVLARAALFGLGGAIAGALIYYAVLAATGYEIGIVAIAVGFLVGRAVQMGSRGQRGRAFQIMAVILTYIGIGAGYAPQAFKHGDFTVISGIIVAVALPIMVVVTGFPQTILTAIIIAVGLRQAWQMNHAPPRPVFHGPFRVGGGAAPA
jgi:hypothetical protein